MEKHDFSALPAFLIVENGLDSFSSCFGSVDSIEDFSDSQVDNGWRWGLGKQVVSMGDSGCVTCTCILK